MLHFFDPLREVNFLTTVFRLLFACLIGAVLGLERSYHNKPAGFRTHILVCLGGSVASLTGLYLYLVLGLPTDMSRIGANVISGISFIGAGTIFVTHKRTVKGLTTAAGLWVAGIIGLAIGAGFYEGSLIALILVLFTETYLTQLRSKITHYPEFHIAVSYVHRDNLDVVLRFCKDQNCSITNLQVSGSTSGNNAFYNSLITLRPGSEVDPTELIADIKEISGVISSEII